MIAERDFLYAMSVGLLVGCAIGAVVAFAFLVGFLDRHPPRRRL